MKIANIDANIVEDMESSDHPSIFETGEGYGVLIMRLPEMVRGAVDIHSYAFLVEDGKVYRYIRDEKRLGEMGDFGALHRFLDSKVDRLLSEIQMYHYDIESLEDTLYEDSMASEFMAMWLTYKKDVSLINRLMMHADIAFERFICHYRDRQDIDNMDYADLIEHIGRVADLARSAMEKLDNLHSFYRAKVDERMNRTVYWLTVISAIFLPLTLVTGFFGMNTGGLPYTSDSAGTLKVVGISIVLEALFLLAFVWATRERTKRFVRHDGVVERGRKGK